MSTGTVTAKLLRIVAPSHGYIVCWVGGDGGGGGAGPGPSSGGAHMRSGGGRQGGGECGGAPEAAPARRWRHGRVWLAVFAGEHSVARCVINVLLFGVLPTRLVLGSGTRLDIAVPIQNDPGFVREMRWFRNLRPQTCANVAWAQPTFSLRERAAFLVCLTLLAFACGRSVCAKHVSGPACVHAHGCMQLAATCAGCCLLAAVYRSSIKRQTDQLMN